ncbi:tRNA (adenosine(37)-N6)-dimethylallyltransferase MiaA [Lentisphaera profundi]|uniref:tRNA dimethylallyltransferase n=1 Tax=Lentisphaera profundi TaxID=1658616 RepID=A0ABY7W1C6_9BACT|nr:tRNA (adenosine(37)-N6)-dimethylallyltransferase MiaA [Lentisphaera profundi]WDE98784.1 tRNA (adenosine(37)-N6)-dimethylallyltransferase MiaA [Lentisphaera profundi]
MNKKLISILGPTASGKSSLAFALAKKLQCPIISCDSMQNYRKLDIGSAKPSIDELKQIKHHMVDELDINQSWTAAAFYEQAEEIRLEHQKNEQALIMAGGTGLYAKMFLYGADTLPSDKTLAQEIRERYEQEGSTHIFAELAKIDPLSAEKLKDNDRRMLRAYEAAKLLNGPLPERSFAQEPRFDCRQIILMPAAELSRELIAKRCIKMLSEGWIEEAQELIQQGLLESPTACQALGYKEIQQFLLGALDRNELQERLIIKTCQYAKRQRTWFRNQHPGAEVFTYQNSEERELVFKTILDEF